MRDARVWKVDGSMVSMRYSFQLCVFSQALSTYFVKVFEYRSLRPISF